jgi:FimV-like protein
MTQVYVSLARFEYNKREYGTSADYYSTQQKIYEQLVSADSLASVSQQSLIREEMNLMVAEIKLDIAYSEMENSYAAIFAALGLDLMPRHAYLMPLWAIEDILKKKFSALTLYDEIFGMSAAESIPQTISSLQIPAETPEEDDLPSPIDTTPAPVAVTRQERPSSDQETTPRITYYTSDAFRSANSPETLWSIAVRVRPDNSVSIQQTMIAIFRANPDAFLGSNINGLLHGQTLRIPDRPEIQRVASNEAQEEVQLQNEIWEDLKCVLMVPVICN